MKCSTCGATENLIVAGTRYRSTTKDYYIRYVCPLHKRIRKPYVSKAKHRTSWELFTERADQEWRQRARENNERIIRKYSMLKLNG